MAVSKLDEDVHNNENSDSSKKDKKARKRKKGVYRRIVSQTEFYLSDANLRHSKFLLPIYQSDPWIPLKLFLTFNKVASMLSEVLEPGASDEDKIVELEKALSYIDSDNVVLSECKTKVSRKSPFVPAASTDIDSCTVYAENLPPGNFTYCPYSEVSNNLSLFQMLIMITSETSFSPMEKLFMSLSQSSSPAEQKVLHS